jgi:hypothetical protein
MASWAATVSHERGTDGGHGQVGRGPHITLFPNAARERSGEVAASSPGNLDWRLSAGFVAEP